LQFLERDYETENLTKRNSKETLKQDWVQDPEESVFTDAFKADKGAK
jgi:hypothetical protein